MTKDPIGFKGGINQYAYVGNNPVTNVDPLGLCKCSGGVWDQEFGDHQVSFGFGFYFSAGNVNYTCRSNPKVKCSGKQTCIGGGAFAGGGLSWNLTGTIYGVNDSQNLGGWSNWNLNVGAGPFGIQAPFGAGGNASGGASFKGGVALIRCYTSSLKCDCPCELK